MYIWGYQTPVFIPNLYDLVKKNSFLVKFFHFQGTNVHLGLPNSSFYPNRVKKNFIFCENFPFLGNKCTFGGTKLRFLSPICTIGSKTSFLVKFFHFQETNVHLGVPNSSFYSHRVKKTSFLVKFFHFQGTIVHLGVPNSSFYTHWVKKISFLVKCFHFQETNVHLGVPNYSFYPHRVKKTSFLVKFFHFQEKNVHLGVPNSSFYPNQIKKTSFLVKFLHFQGKNVHLWVPNSSFYPQFGRSGQKKLIFSEIFPFLGNKCTFGGTKLQFLSPSGQKTFIFSEIIPFLGNKCTFGGTKLQFLSPLCTIGSKKLHFQ